MPRSISKANRESARTVVTFLARGLALSSFVFCAACALPKAAPIAANVEEAPDTTNADYFVVPLVPPVVQIMGNRREAGFPAAFQLSDYRPSIALKPGDVISVTIYEVGNSPTFGSLTLRSSFAALPDSESQASLEDRMPLPGLGASDLARFTNIIKPSAQYGIEVASNDPKSLKLSQITPQIGVAPSAGPTTPSSAPTPAPVPAPTQTSLPRTLPPLTVESNGDILIPYAGNVHVAGKTPTQAAEDIRTALSDKAVNPQVLVSFVSNGTNQATVGGEANRPGSVFLTLRGERLLDAIGQAGGSKWPAFDTDVDILRDGHGARVKLQTIVENPSENIRVSPNDQIFLTHNPRSFTVLGASQKPAQYTFDTPRVTLAEAVARAGGAIDTIGNPAAVYLFREEPNQIARRVLTLASSLMPAATGKPAARLDPYRVKLVYKLNMNSAEGYFVARKIFMLDRDVVLIANAEGTQLLKAFTLIRGVTGAISDLNIVGHGTSR